MTHERSTYARTLAARAALHALTAAEWASRVGNGNGPDSALAREILIAQAKEASRLAKLALKHGEEEVEECAELLTTKVRPAV